MDNKEVIEKAFDEYLINKEKTKIYRGLILSRIVWIFLTLWNILLIIWAIYK